MKKRILCLTILFIHCLSISAQNYYNKLYRFDSLKRQSVQFTSMLVSDNNIYATGIGAVVDSIFVDNLGFFSNFSLLGELQKQKYYGKYPQTAEFLSNNLIKISENLFAAAGLNQDSSFTLIKIDNNGNRVFQKDYFPESNQYFFFIPYSITPLSQGNLCVVVPASYKGYVNSVLIILDSLGNKKSLFEYPSDVFYPYNVPTKILTTKSGNILIAAYRLSNGDNLDPSHRFFTQLMEVDTAGIISWVYNTPLERYIHSDNIQELPNGNVLMWGREDFPRRVRQYQVYDSKAYIAEVNKNNDVVWERRFDFGIGSQFTDVKVLKDQSILAVGHALTLKDTTSYGILFKMNSRHDSVFTRYLHNEQLRTYYSNESRLVQIECLDNGDLIMAGHFYDTYTRSPTFGQWAWLLRTDSLGCFVSNCGLTSTTEKEATDPSVNLTLYPNPTHELLNLRFNNPNQLKYNISIYDYLGKQVFSGFNIDTIDVQHFTLGLYVIKLVLGNKDIYKKFIVNP